MVTLLGGAGNVGAVLAEQLGAGAGRTVGAAGNDDEGAGPRHPVDLLVRVARHDVAVSVAVDIADGDVEAQEVLGLLDARYPWGVLVDHQGRAGHVGAVRGAVEDLESATAHDDLRAPVAVEVTEGQEVTGADPLALCVPQHDRRLEAVAGSAGVQQMVAAVALVVAVERAGMGDEVGDAVAVHVTVHDLGQVRVAVGEFEAAGVRGHTVPADRPVLHAGGPDQVLVPVAVEVTGVRDAALVQAVAHGGQDLAGGEAVGAAPQHGPVALSGDAALLPLLLAGLDHQVGESVPVQVGGGQRGTELVPRLDGAGHTGRRLRVHLPGRRLQPARRPEQHGHVTGVGLPVHRRVVSGDGEIPVAVAVEVLQYVRRGGRLCVGHRRRADGPGQQGDSDGDGTPSSSGYGKGHVDSGRGKGS